MKQRTQFEKLVAASRGEPWPHAEVVNRVLTSISATPDVIADRPLQWMAGLSAAAALVVAIQTGVLSSMYGDPLGYWLSTLTVVMQ
jgi:hypothetical protein